MFNNNNNKSISSTENNINKANTGSEEEVNTKNENITFNVQAKGNPKIQVSYKNESVIKKEYPGFMVVEWDIAKPGNRRRDPCACEPEQNDSAFIPFATRPA